jgi:hypothetical protein
LGHDKTAAPGGVKKHQQKALHKKKVTTFCSATSSLPQKAFKTFLIDGSTAYYIGNSFSLRRMRIERIFLRVDVVRFICGHQLPAFFAFGV